MPETAIFDHYEVMTRDDGSLFELGRGAMGITYKAFDTSLRIPVALKVINAAYLNSEIARQRFVREARSAAKLRHRHVASVFHLGTEGDTWFYAMEFIDGETLAGLIKRQGPLAPVLALTITAQVARALNAATQHGLVHRDIKPANLMLVHEDDDLVAKVIDFGLAKTAQAFEGDEAAATLSMGGFVGTPHFASPEQLEEKEIDVRSDIYSLGVTLWYMLAGQEPFSGSMAQVMSQHLSKPPPFEKFDNLATPVADLLRKMLEKDPADRFQTPVELRTAIQQALDALADEPAASPPEEERAPTPLDDSSARAGETQFEPGVIVAGRYRLDEVLGETNTGRMFRAYDSERRHDVRLLVLHPEFLNDPTACTALEREVEKLMPVKHQNLLRVFDFETIEQASFLVLQWTEGFSLLELLRARRELDAGEAIALLQQAAAGADHAAELGLTGIEFGLHQVLLHFLSPVEPAQREELLRKPLASWPSFTLKLYPLGIKRDFDSSQTWAGGQTMVGGAPAPKVDDGDLRPRFVQALAGIVYEVLGGTSGKRARYTPLSTLSEEGNEVLKRALDPAQSFASAQEFCTALAQLQGLQVRRPGSRAPLGPPVPPRAAPPAASSTPGSSAPAPAARVIPPVRPAFSSPPISPPELPEKKKIPVAFVGGIVTVIAIGAAIYFSTQKGGEKPGPATPSPVIEPAVIPEPTPTPVVVQPTPTPPPVPTRQDLLMTAVSEAEKLEEKGAWAEALEAWLRITRENPDFGVGRNHLETMLDLLRQRPSPITPDGFKELRDKIAEAAQLDVLSAMLLLGDNLTQTEPVTAFNWYSAAAAKGSPVALTQLGLMFSNGAGTIKPDLAKAVASFQEAVDKGDAAGKAALAECYLSANKGVAKDEKRALGLLHEAVEQGNLRAMNRLGDCEVKGVGGKTDLAEAFSLFSQAADRGFAEAMGNLGVLYITGSGIPANAKKAVELFEKGARLGNAFCMRLYAQCLHDGQGVSKNHLQAVMWYRKAAEAGDQVAIDWCKENNVPFTHH